MTSLRQIIRESIQIAENLQLADKVYFNTGKLSPEVKRYILHITGGDAWTKLIADIYYLELKQSRESSRAILSLLSGDDEEEYKEPKDGEDDVLNLEYWKTLKNRYYLQLKQYNKNLFPIAGLNPNGVSDLQELVRCLYQRDKILQEIKKLPSIALRNLREDFRIVRNSEELNHYRDRLEYFNANYKQLNNRSPRAKAVIDKKMFKSGITLEDLVDFVEEKENLIGGKRLSKADVKKIINENSYDLEIVYEKGNIMIVDVTGQDGIKALGCNSVWCFTYGLGVYRNNGSWSQNSTNGQVYVIIDFSKPSDSAEFMYVIVKPLDFKADPNDETVNDNKMADMSNNYIDVPLLVISHLMNLDDAYQIINFGEERMGPNSEWPYKDPNQLKLDLQEVRKIVRKFYTTI